MRKTARKAAGVALFALSLSAAVGAAPFMPLDFGQVVNGFQDDFHGQVRDPNWVAIPPERDFYVQTNKILHVPSLRGDPNHLVYAAPGYHAEAQEVLARIRVTALHSGRAGIGVAVDANAPHPGEGINLLFLHNQFGLLNDYRAVGPALDLSYTNGVWYWLRLRQTGSRSTGEANILGKVWRADGTVPEPLDWPITWTQEGRAGWAGITGSSGGQAEFDVDYFLIKADGLPRIRVGPRFMVLAEPQDAIVGLGQTAVFSIVVESASPLTYQWQKASPAGTDFTDLANATQAHYTTAVLAKADHSTKYRCVVSSPQTTIASSEARVCIDTVPPALVSARTFGNPTRVTVVFSEPVLDSASRANFVIDQGIQVTGVATSANPNTVELLTTPLASNRAYTLTVRGIQDRFGNTQLAPAQIPIDLSANDTFWVIPHTHWEGAVFQTREDYLEMGLPIILQALKLLQTYPHYRFVLDQAAYVKPFLERYPEAQAAFRQFVAEGRLQLVGGMDVMPDDNMPSGESFIRQVLYGKGYFREKLGVEVTVGWLLDTFGHHAQMPQLLKQAGYKSFWFFRGVPSPDVHSEFVWQGLDGASIPAYWLPHGYAVTYGSPHQLGEFTRFFKGRFDSLTRFARGSHRVGLAGADVSEPEEHLPVRVEEFNREGEASFMLRFGVPTDFEAVVANRPNPPVVKGELNPIFQGTYSSRIELKQWTRNLEYWLTTAEKLGALGNWLGLPTDPDMMWRAWEPMLFNHAHDLMSGVMTDRVYEDTVRGYDFSKRLAEELVATGLDRLAAKIDTQGEGIPLVVFNPLGWPRTDIAEADVGFGEGGILGLKVIDPDGLETPVQFLAAERYSGGRLKRAKITFLARGVPGLGYAVYRVIPLRSAKEAQDQGNAEPDSTVIENEFYRITFHRLTGEITSLRVKRGDWEVLAGPANVVACEHDGGDFWELYETLHGGSNIAMKRQQPVPKSGQAQFSNAYVGEKGSVRQGPVYSEFSVSHPFTNGTFSTRVRLYAGMRRIDIQTQILNNEKFVRYQVLFPTTIKNGQGIHEIPFGAIERPSAIEFPAQNWIDYGNGKQGVALLNRGLPGNLVTDATLILSLLRSTCIVAYGFGGGYGPGMASDSGFELGKKLTFNYALVPHAGDWRQAGVFREGWEFNSPFIVHKPTRHPGPLPNRWGWLEVSAPTAIVTAVKPGPDGSTILRLYEAAGQAAPGVKLKLQAKIIAAYEANLMEDTGASLAVSNDTIQFDLRPFEIKTFKLRLQNPD